MSLSNGTSPRVNGWSRPLSEEQILAALFVWGSAGLYYGLVYPYAPPNLKNTVFLVPYTVVMVICIFLYFYVETVDPIRLNENMKFDSKKRYRFCEYCDNTKPMKLTTKHCHICEKCVSHFDHHCKWLNTCIGAKNYWHFFTMLALIIVLQLLHLSLSIVIFADNKTEERVNGPFSRYEVYAVLLSLSFVPSLTVLGGVSALFSFHVYLKCVGTTTYIYLKGEDYLRIQFEGAKRLPPIAIEEKQKQERNRWLKEREERKKTREKRLKTENSNVSDNSTLFNVVELVSGTSNVADAVYEGSYRSNAPPTSPVMNAVAVPMSDTTAE
mmetsp:Transcript_24463/g.36691  ORF Transcript_24463/g.36691 Transcript_24463/m.36691 type:complete len:326 (+) Transcript_24463:59-1036(+)